MIICVGPSGSGKTLLLKRLSSGQLERISYTDIPNTVSTIGTNIVSLTIKESKISIQEVGGSMTEIWDQYYSDCAAILFVIDSTNVSKLGDSCTLLMQLVSHIDVKHKKPILLVLNKTDVSCTSSMEEIRHFLMIDEIMESVPKQIEVIEASCITNKGLDSIFNWIESFCETTSNN